MSFKILTFLYNNETFELINQNIRNTTTSSIVTIFIVFYFRSIFQDMVSMDMLVMKIMNFAQRLVNADRASLFLVDSKNKGKVLLLIRIIIIELAF